MDVSNSLKVQVGLVQYIGIVVSVETGEWSLETANISSPPKTEK